TSRLGRRPRQIPAGRLPSKCDGTVDRPDRRPGAIAPYGADCGAASGVSCAGNMLAVNEPQIYPNVEIGPGTVLEPGVVIGLPAGGAEPGALPTRIGGGGRIRSGTVIYAGVVIGSAVSTGHGALIREDNVIGDDCSVGTHAVLE